MANNRMIALTGIVLIPLIYKKLITGNFILSDI